jgi:hypothetical protein
VTVRLVPRAPRPEQPQRTLWTLRGRRLPVTCIAIDYPHGTDLLLMQGDDLARSALITAGPAFVQAQADEWKAALLAKGWTESA